MKHFYIFLLSVIFFSATSQVALSQSCTSATPLFYVDLTGQPNGVWQSPSILRGGDCCGTDNNCIEFIVTLDSMATGILFNIAAGAMPGGALYYQVNCGPLTSIGTPVCLNGPGPHDITFCKPGNNLNVYEIASIPIPAVQGTEWVSEACSGNMSILGLNSTTTVWSSVPSNPLYNSFLSCTSGCNSVTINPTGILPPFIDYQVCGYPTGGCYTTPFCDTMRVNFVNTLAVAITPQNPVICFGAPPAMVTANASGGNDPYNFTWSNGATTPSIAVGPGTYYVSITDSMNCSIATDSVVVSAMASTIIASAGPDQVLCLNNSAAQLNGSVTAATGGQWFGGAGIFTPNNTTLNALYTPTPLEINNGSIQLSLITTGNNTCPADTDLIIISLSPNPSPQLQGTTTACEFSTTTYTTPLISGHTYIWNVTGGTVLNTLNNSITVLWGATGNGTVSVTETNALLCDSTVTINISITPQPVPVINGPLVICTTTTTSYSVSTPVPGNIYAWNVTGGSIIGPANGTSISVLWNASGSPIISVTETNPLGCDSTISVSATALTMPAPVIAGPDTICEMQIVTYTTPLTTGNNYNWNITGGTILSTTNNSISVQWPVSGNGTVSVTETNTSACDSTITMNIVIAPQPIPVINGSLINCTTTGTQFNVAAPVPGNTYSWIVNGGTISGPSNGTSINVFWTNSGTATITLNESNRLGCDSSVTATATILTMPAPVIAGPDTICEMETITYSTPLVPGNTYSWNVTGGTVVSTNSNMITVTWPANGNGSISVTETNTSNCDSTVSTTIIIAPQPAPVISGATTTCTSTTTSFNAATVVPGNTYAWTVTGGTIIGSPNGASINVVWTTSGTATIMLTESNNMGCDSTVSVAVNVLTLPTPVISGPDSVCALHTFVYSTTLVSGNTYSWGVNGGTIVANNNNSISVAWPANGSGSVTLTESNSNTCGTSVTQNIFIAPQPVPEINGSLTSCSATYSQFSAINTTTGNTFAWSITGGTIVGASNGSAVSIFWNNSGTATLSFTESNNLGCDSTVTVIINVLQRPAPEISGPPVVCDEIQATYTVSSYIPTHTYYWSVTNGTIIGLNVGNSIDVLWSAPGTGSITLRQVSTNGCDSTTAINVLINPLPAPAIFGPPFSCETETVSYTTVQVPGNTYQWSTTGGFIIGNPNTSQITISWASGPMANVYLTETTAAGCSRSIQLPVQIRNKPEPGIQGSAFGCIGTTQNNYFTIPEPDINYQWSASGGTITSGNGTANITVQWQNTGTQTITLTAVNAITGCDSTVVFNVQTGALPTPVIQAPTLSGCIPLTTNFNGNVLDPDYNYFWNFGDGTTGTGPNPSHEYDQPGNYNLQLIATNNTGCADTVTAQAIAFPVPEAAFNLWHGTEVYYANISTMTLTNLSTGGTGYFWTFGDGSNSQEFEPDHQYTTPGNYTIALVVTNQQGCKDVAVNSLEVKLPEDLYIPNAFTPNGDNKNDYFSVVAYNINSFRINIFNRWGRVIYSSTDPSFQWDGKNNGSDVINDVYVYTVEATGMYGTNFNLTGTVTVVK